MIFFDGWTPIFRTAIAGLSAYVALILILRISGKRTLSKWNAFDYVVTVGLGSTLATILLSKDTSLAQGVAALFLLVGLQFVVTWLSVRFRGVSELVKARPVLLFRDGEMQHAAMREARVAEGEILAALRNDGIADRREAGAVVLETDGSFSVIRKVGEDDDSTLADVRGFSARRST